MTNKSFYLERATQWVNGEINDSDVTVEGLEATIAKFSQELSKAKSTKPLDEVRIDDLSKTISYLNTSLKGLVSSMDQDGDITEITASNISMIETEATSQVDIEYNPSPLIDYADVQAVTLTEHEKKLALENIRANPLILRSAGEIKKRPTGTSSDMSLALNKGE